MGVRGESMWWCWREGRRTDSGCAVHFEDVDAFGDGGAGVVDDVEHGLCGGCQLVYGERLTVECTFSWIMVAVLM
jgi:hypothetical protein